MSDRPRHFDTHAGEELSGQFWTGLLIGILLGLFASAL
jgi:hypothetical protein